MAETEGEVLGAGKAAVSEHQEISARARCTRPNAQTAARTAKCPSSQPKASLCIARNATESAEGSKIPDTQTYSFAFLFVFFF